MKSIIQKINNQLLEKYPLVWNTKLVWMLATSAALHLIFFLIGLASLLSPTVLHTYNAIDIYFTNGMALVGVILSVLVLTIWLLAMFKNNAFKNFYPQSVWKLFLQLLHYIVIIFFSITFYYSYTFGLQVYTHLEYDDERVAQEIDVINQAAPFFSHEINQYTLKKVRYPEPLEDLYCDTNEERIDKSKPFYTWMGEEYQFNSTQLVISSYGRDRIEIARPYEAGFLFDRQDGDTLYSFYRKEIIDVSDYIKTEKPSYYHYSSLFSESSDYYDYEEFSYDKSYMEDAILELSPEERGAIARTHQLLNNASKDEIHQVLEKFLAVATAYQIRTNLDAESWTQLVYHPGEFEIHGLINKSKGPYRKEQVARYQNNAQLAQYINNLFTAYYLDSTSLRAMLRNIQEIKSHKLFETSIHIFMWITLSLSILIFIFRVSGLRPLLFSLLGSGLLGIFIALIAAGTAFLNAEMDDIGLFITSISLLLIGAIILLGVFKLTHFRKLTGAVLMNLSMILAIPFLWLVAVMINIIQSGQCRIERLQVVGKPIYEEDCFTLFDDALPLVSFTVLVLTLVFLWAYSKKIMQWRAMPEG